MRSDLFVATCLLSACGGPLPPSAAPATSDVVASPPRRADFTVVPAELADPGIMDRIRHRTRVRRLGNAWIRSEGEAIRSSRDTKTDGEYVLPVIGETRTKIRVVTEDDEARLAIWIARDDTWKAITVPLQLSDREGRASPQAGIWVSLGAPVDVSPQRGERRRVRVRDVDVTIDGFAPANAIANIWLAPPGDRTPTDLDLRMNHAFAPPLDARAKIAIGTKIRAAPHAGAPVIAMVETADVRGKILANLGTVRELEVVRPYARIRGFVAASELSHATDDFNGHGSGSGHGFGMSHADRIDLVPGTCLFDAIDGEVVGVQVEPSTRLGHRKTDGAGWSIVYVGTVWSIVTLYVHDTGDDPKQPRWESCTAHRSQERPR